MKKLTKILVLSLMTLGLFSCSNFLDVVPNDTANISKSFKREAQARKFLYSCYSYLPRFSNDGSDPLSGSFLSTSEIWMPESRKTWGGSIAHGEQTPVNPYLNFWEGRRGGYSLYRGIRQCNIFLKNISNVGDMGAARKNKWSAEVKFLKAYYTFYLIRMYGPIVLSKHNIPISASKSETKSVRASVDSAFNYVIKLLNEVIHTSELPARISNTQKKYGRITKSIAYAIKAKVEVTAASPLFNGSNIFTGFKNKNGVNPFSTEEDPAKWDSAKVASKQAIDFLKNHNFHQYTFKGAVVVGSNLSDSTRLKMTLRNSVTLGRNQVNPGVIWAYTGRPVGYIQNNCLPIGLNHKNPQNYVVKGSFGVPLKIADMFYSNHGVPLKQDKTRNYSNRYNVEEIGKDERYYLKQGYRTAGINMHREPRYYADLDFDGAIHFGNGTYKGGPDNYTYIQAKKGQINAIIVNGNQYSPTGIWVKKLLNYQTEIGDTGTDLTYNGYNWPIMRMSDLYLLYAEAKNEVDGPGPQVYKYLNEVRKHAGIPTVQKSWSDYSTIPNQYKSKSGLRKIIHQERLIELAFEGQRYWDLRRWQEAAQKLNQPVTGWDRRYKTAKDYYQPRKLFQRQFTIKDYFWPISEQELNTNTNLTQNPGWD